MVEKYGFIYIWFDKRDKRYYVGCHWGFEDDGYICSSNWMRNTYRRRPEDFKRRIIKRIYTTRQDLFTEEQRYLDMIKPEEVRIRYFNLHVTVGHWSSDPNKLLTVGEKISKAKTGKSPTDEARKNMSESRKGEKNHFFGKHHSEENKQKLKEMNKGQVPPNKGVPMSEEQRQKLIGYRHTEESKQKMSESLKGCTAHNKGVPMSDEQKELLRKANTGRVISEETRQKLKNRKASDETKQQMSESIKCLKWYNNGIKNTRAKECPGPDWIAGRIYNINSL